MAPFPSFTKTWHTSTYPSISPTRPELSLLGKTAVITGGGIGIGLAISKALALAGISKLAIIGRRTAVLSAAKKEINLLVGNRTTVFTTSADVSSKKQVDQAFSLISREFGQKLDILVANAGYFSGFKNLGEESEEDWANVMGINIKGVAFVASAFATHAAENATIINISTAIVHVDPMPGFLSYAATKSAGSKVIQYVASEHKGFHVVEFHPGRVRETEMAQKVQGKDGFLDHIDDADLAGHFAVWLASPEAKFLKGKFVWCNWDVDELKEKAKEIEGSGALNLGLDGWAIY
ncbi:hypothetical protein G7Y89_g12268 [Cudoniella acicularis]|uniref:Uncharacterized protein n=1 Tax=Cudoniella acicularis TaxID=354080 RepID=A0A8H4R968_9HELO|nr:hypothetical protein G7Y89_g12268 [Cudoniella acicularis]